MMNCKRARLAIALSVGSDLDENGEAELHEHLAECGSCRVHRKDLEGTLGALHGRPDEEPLAMRDSVWPAVSSRLSPRREQRFNGWIPAAALAASVLMMVAVMREPQPDVPVAGSYDSYQSAPVRGYHWVMPEPAPSEFQLPAGDWTVPVGARRIQRVVPELDTRGDWRQDDMSRQWVNEFEN